MKITNNVLSKRMITPSYVWWDGIFTNNELDSIEHICNLETLENSTIMGGNENIDQIRRSKVKFFEPNDCNNWIFEKFNNHIERVNNEYYDFDLYGYDSFQYTVYNSENSGMYEWHMDTVLNQPPDDMKWHANRKLSIVMVVNTPNKDFTGGEFQINEGIEKNAYNVDMKRGRIIAFPSFILHRVAPVLTGIRKSIVIWVEGPKFR